MSQSFYFSLLAVLLGILCLPQPSRALDSAIVNPPAVSPLNSGANNCSYFYIDTYTNTTMVGATRDPSLTGQEFLSLQLYNNGSPIYTTAPLPCAGTYQLTFTIELQATTNVASMMAYTYVMDSMTASGNAFFITTLYPQCNNGSYATTPYCSVVWITHSTQLNLPIADQVWAPQFMVTAPVTVLGGQFELIFLHP